MVRLFIFITFLIKLFTISESLEFGNNLVVRSISSHEALIVMKKWCLDIQISDDSIITEDGDTDIRITDDSYSGPFKLNIHDYEENKKIKQIKEVADWLSGSRKKNGIFVSVIDESEKMLAFVEKKNKNVRVNGFLAHPFIDYLEHESSKSALALTLLEIASDNDENILFVFDK